MKYSNEIKIDLLKVRAKKFWDKVVRGTEDECWLWSSSREARYGYGRFSLGRKTPGKGTNIKIQSHQAAFVLSFGYLPPVVRHSCDNPPCCNPKHLLAGTHADNVADRVERNRSAIGSKNGRTKLSIEQVQYIKRSSKSPQELASECKVSKRAITLIQSGKNWRHVS